MWLKTFYENICSPHTLIFDKKICSPYSSSWWCEMLFLEEDVERLHTGRSVICVSLAQEENISTGIGQGRWLLRMLRKFNILWGLTLNASKLKRRPLNYGRDGKLLVLKYVSVVSLNNGNTWECWWKIQWSLFWKDLTVEIIILFESLGPLN